MSIKYTDSAKAFITGVAASCIVCMAGLAIVMFKSFDSSSGIKVHYMDESKDIEILECNLRLVKNSLNDEVLEKLKSGRLSVSAECSKRK